MSKIMLHGDCRIDRISDLHELFLQYLKRPEHRFEVDMSDIERCDLSFFQLMCAASRSFNKSGKAMKRTGLLPEIVVRQYHKTGMGPACLICPQKDCFLKDQAAAGSINAVEIKTTIQGSGQHHDQ